MEGRAGFPITDIIDRLPRHSRLNQPDGPQWRERPADALRRVVIHSSFGPDLQSPQEIALYHISKGWSGLAYHFLIYYNGIIYKVRPVLITGTCVKDANTPSVCICFVGDHRVEVPATAAWAAGVWLTQDLMRHYPALEEVSSHREMIPGYTCPGAMFDMDAFRRDVYSATPIIDGAPRATRGR